MRKLTLMILAVAGMMACTESYYDQQKADGDQPIRFSATIAEDWNTMTRGVKFTGTTFNIPFSVSGYRYGSGQTVADVANANFFYNKTVSPVNSEWIAEGTYTWPANGDLLDFFAYAPVGGAGITPVNAEGGLQINFTVQSNVDDQIDLMTSTVSGESFNTTLGYKVTLPFGHALTAVQFVLDKNVAPGTIKQIDLVNVVTTGTLHLADNTWHNLSNTTFTIKYSDANDQGGFSTVGNDGFIDVGAELVGTASPLLMIPQTFTSAEQGIRVIIDTGGSQPQTLYAKLSSDDVEHPNKWEAGKTVTYMISTSGINVLQISEVSYPATWNTASTAFNSIKSSYVTTDVLGVYAVDDDGTVIVDNQPLTKTDNGWSSSILFVPGLTYFAYYPYNSDGLAHNGLKDNAVVTTAEEFFASGISSWAPADDQSTAAKLNAQDLQVGTGELQSASTISFAMAHKMGLASVNIPASKNVSNLVYFEANGTTISSSSEETTTVAPSTTITGDYQLCNGATANQQFMVVKPNTNYTFTPTTTNLYDSWDADVTANVSAGGYTPYDVTNKVWTRGYVRRGWVYDCTNGTQSLLIPKTGTYTLEVWGGQGGLPNTGNTNYAAYVKGGYSTGTKSLTKDNILYVCVGGCGGSGSSVSETQGVGGAGGYNGGGKGGDSSTQGSAAGGGGGGGATHIALTYDGTLYDLLNDNSKKNSVLIVAGGGGGCVYHQVGGTGGGVTGGSSQDAYPIGVGGNTGSANIPVQQGASSSNYYALGKGQDGYKKTVHNGHGTHGTGGGGGGYYGGGAYQGQGQYTDVGGGGGTGYIGGVDNGSTSNGVRLGNGYARITSHVVE